VQRLEQRIETPCDARRHGLATAKSDPVHGPTALAHDHVAVEPLPARTPE
jgi:hypothetical protein